MRDTIVTTGSFVGAALWTLSPRANFTGAALLGGVGTLLYVRTLLKQSNALQDTEFGC